MRKLTQRDISQIPIYCHDEELNANRVIIVGGDLSNFIENFNEQLQQTLSKIEVNVKESSVPVTTVPQVQIEYKEIEKPIIIKEIEFREIEKPIFIKEIEIREVEKPVIITKTETKIEYIEKPVIVIQEKMIDIPNSIKIVVGIQSLILFGLLVTLIIK